MGKKIRSNVVKQSLLDYAALADSLKENTAGAVKSLLDEAVRDTYAKLLTEGDGKDYEEEEVEDTDDTIADDNAAMDDGAPSEDDGGADAEKALPAEDGVSDDEPIDDSEVEGAESSDDADGSLEGEDAEGQDDEWAEFDKYKVGEDEYDLSSANDDDIVKVYKRMKDDDEIEIHKDGDGNVNISDNQTGAEYIINLGGSSEGSMGNEGENVSDEFEGESGDEFDNGIEDDDMNESTERMFELVLEYDSNVGYTDNYQKKDVMTSDGVSEPGKNVRDWDAGVPKDTKKPWSGYPSKKNKADKPFNDSKGKKVEENAENECGDAIDGGEEINELKTVEEHPANVGSTSRTDGPNNPRRRKGRNFHTAQNGQETGTADNAYGQKAEAMIRRMDKALSENKELKGTLTKVMESLKEAAVTNHNLAQIIKLISENSTSRDEKMEIIERFKNEAKTVQESKNLYEAISRDLKKANKMSITEDRQLSAEGSRKINETTIYKSQDMLDSLDLMHRMMK